MIVRIAVFLVSFLICVWQWYAVVAQDSARKEQPKAAVQDKSPKDPAAKETAPKDLRDGQLAISGRYARFERMLSQMADILGRQDPERADLLRRAIGKGREELVKEDIENIIELLDDGELGTASEKQTEVIGSLQTLLKLLQSEDRRSSVERERERLNELLKDVRNVLAEQKSARAATQNSQAPSNAAPGQQRAISETDQLLESIEEHDGQEAKEAEQGAESAGESKDGDSKDGESKDGQPKDGESKDDKSKDGKSGEGDDSKDADAKKAKNGNGSKSKSGQKSAGQKSGGKESKQTPGREQLEKAREQMEQALEELKEQEREKALENEDAAIEELHEAAEQLEEMLKQLREEEKEMMLASLEARFQRMLAAETQIHEGTLSLAATPQKDWLDQYYGRCRDFAQQQSELATECSQTVNLLREDGTAVAILLAVEDIEADMMTVNGWLQESKVGELTQSVQTDIIDSLKQLIETTQQEMQEMKEKDQQSSPQQDGQEKQGLVELMAEIRMLRNLQLQVNRRTKKVDGLLKSAPTDDVISLQKQVHDLAVRQRRLIESAKELAKQAK